ncbi:MAG: hypothetical protein COA80_16880 [Leeuwenhoekiella sp.]|nr:MAG: hypothetical protein COA80_16880 [Leeuwenhoekiella sp.]
MYYFLILSSVSLVIGLSYFGFRFIEHRIGGSFSQSKIAFFYGYVALVYALAALVVSWMWVYYINVFIGLPCLITGYFCARRYRRLRAGKKRYKLFLVLSSIALLLALLSLIAFLNR